MPFEKLRVSPRFTTILKNLGFHQPTEIQEQAIPAIVAGQDVIGLAKTGSGKTAAYLLPTMTRLLAERKTGSTRVLILVPTRELALQVETMSHDFSKPVGISCAAVFGGVGMDAQVKALKAGTDIIVATPGRLMDHMERGYCRFYHLNVLVLDEADRMLDMGFFPDIRKIISKLPAINRQNLLFSATMPDEIKKLAHTLMKHPITIKIGHPERATIPVGITHAVYPVPQHLKAKLLISLLQQAQMPSVLVFTRTKIGADKVKAKLQAQGLTVAVIHSDRTQFERVKALEGFREGRYQVLVATDIAARGIDVENITHVINYDLPQTPDDYVHRVGRTARVEAKGDAFSLVSPDERDALHDIEKNLSLHLPHVTLPDFNYHEPAPERHHAPRHGKPHGVPHRGPSGGHAGGPGSKPRGGRPPFRRHR